VVSARYHAESRRFDCQRPREPAAGLSIKTSWAFQAAVMNGTDPAPQDVKAQQGLFKNKQVKVFLYNVQAVDDATTSLLALAKSNSTFSLATVWSSLLLAYHTGRPIGFFVSGIGAFLYAFSRIAFLARSRKS
jgi:hypothetical protein